MLKPRLIFTLLYADGTFNVSRNFNLQSIGDLDWLMNNYEFESIARSIDELVVLNASRGDYDHDLFISVIKKIAGFSFMPLAVGGKISKPEDAALLFNSGADKVVLNTAFEKDTALVQTLARHYGSQSIVASIDYKRSANDHQTFINNGSTATGKNLSEAVSAAASAGAGEIYLTSIDRDGTGIGYDLESLKIGFESCTLPIIAAGGADTYDKLVEGIATGHASAVSTSHLFNFMGDGLRDARELMEENGVVLSKWDFSQFEYQ